MKLSPGLLAATALIAGLAPAQAIAKQGDIIARARAIMVVPNESSGTIQPGFPTERVSVNNAVMPEIDFTYMFTDTIGAELILSSTKHQVRGTQALKPLGNLAGTWVLPPTITVQYHFPTGGKIRPYIGAGLNYTIFYSEKASSALNAALGDTRVHLKDSFGYAVQAGVDIDIAKNLFMNFDIKYIDMDTKARLTSPGGINRVKVSLDPIILGVGIGTRF